MTTELDRKLLPKVLRAIARVGVNLTISPVAGVYDPSTQTVGAPAAPVTVKSSPPAPVSAEKLAKDSRLTAGDAQVVLAGSGLAIVPKRNMRAKINGLEYEIAELEEYKSGDDTAAWILYLRR